MDLEIKDTQGVKAFFDGQLPMGKDTIPSMGEFRDALATSDAAALLPQAMEEVIREAEEPLLVIASKLFTTIPFEYGSQITVPTLGAIEADFIAEGMEYPEKRLTIGPGTMTAGVGKHGVAVRFTQELEKYSNWPVVGMHLRAMGNAMARHKEDLAVKMLRSMGVNIFDNIYPTQSVKGVCTGRAFDGSANGSVTMDDIFDAMAQMIAQGFMPDTLLMHPLTWVIWVKDPTLRHFALQSGGGTFFANWRGDPVASQPWANAGQSGVGVGNGKNIIPGGNAASMTATQLREYSHTLQSAPILPSYFPFPIQIIVSPMVPFNPVNKLTDIYIADSRWVGLILQDGGVEIDRAEDFLTDMSRIKVRERYSFHMLEEGRAVGKLSNVVVTDNLITLPAQATIEVSSSSLASITATTPIS